MHVILISYAASFTEGTHRAQEYRFFLITHNKYSTSVMSILGECKTQSDLFHRG